MTEDFRSSPVCLIRGGHEGLRIAEEGIRYSRNPDTSILWRSFVVDWTFCVTDSLLESIDEPIAVVCVAGQYRTGKSFFLNQLTHQQHNINNIPNGHDEIESSSPPLQGFRVGATTESCTRGIWLWDPQPSIRNERGERVLLMDTEGIAATDNDESYDAKIFSLGLLLSSLFIFNTMGVIDEGAVDRLYLVSELTKHVCVSANKTTTSSQNGRRNGALENENEEETEDDAALTMKDDLAESRALANHFPPFIWLLRDFLLDMQADGTSLTPNEYLEKALELRDKGNSNNSRRNDERNRIRASIRILFARRECLTLVRPITDESQLRRAADLHPRELRPEFVEQMINVRKRVFSIVEPKQLLGKPMNGRKLAYLTKCYTDTMTSGNIPDIKAAWEYVSEATCHSVLMTASELYDQRIRSTTNESGEILSQQEFEKIHKDAQDAALHMFKTQSVEGAARAMCFQKLKQHIQKQKTAQITILQKESSDFCSAILVDLKQQFLQQPQAQDEWDRLLNDVSSASATDDEISFTSKLDALEQLYERKAQGPAKKIIFYNFLRTDVMNFYRLLLLRLRHWYKQEHTQWQHEVEQLRQTNKALEIDRQQQLQAKAMEIQSLMDGKAHLEDKERLHLERIHELQQQADNKQRMMETMDEKKRMLKEQLDELGRAHTSLEKDLEKIQVTLQHKEAALIKEEEAIQALQREMTQKIEALRGEHQDEKEVYIKRVAEQTAEKTTLQKQLKQKEHEIQQQQRELELQTKKQQQLQQRYDDEVEIHAQKERECTRLRDAIYELETQLQESFRRHMQTEREAADETTRLKLRVERFQKQLGQLEGEREVEDALRDCVNEVVRLSEAEKNSMLQEERQLLQERLGDLYMKISTLPDFYQREIFCSPEPVPDFFDALTSFTSSS